MATFQPQICVGVVFLFVFIPALCYAGPIDTVVDKSMKLRIHICSGRLPEVVSDMCKSLDTEIPQSVRSSSGLPYDVLEKSNRKGSIAASERLVMSARPLGQAFGNLHEECCIGMCNFETLLSYCSF